jgi:putative membrane protein
MTMTARDPSQSDRLERRILTGLVAFYGALWLVLAIEPNNRFDWFIENLLVAVAIPTIIFSYRRFRLSLTSYVMITLFMSLHAFGAHFTYSETPFGDAAKAFFGWERNHYDRLVHFCFGLLLAYPFFDLIARHVRPPFSTWSYVLALALIAALSGLYEIIEWSAAEILAPERALAFLGTQGDVFDGQKDAALALLGALVALSVTAVLSAGGARPRGPT